MRRVVSTVLALAFLFACATFFLIPQILKVLYIGINIADDSYFAMVAKSLALTGRYAVSIGNSPPVLFDPEISSGPGLIIPGAIAIAIFGPQYWVPGAMTLALFLAQLSTCFVLLAGRYGIVSTAVYGGLSILVLSVLTTYRDYYSFFIGEAPACGYFLVGCTILHLYRRPSRLYVAGLFLSAALLTKLILLFSAAGAGAAWLILNANRKSIVRQVLILSAGVITPLALFEFTKLVALGIDGYAQNWHHFLYFMSSQHVPPTDRRSLFMTELTNVYQVTLPFLLCFAASVALAIALLFRKDRMDVRGLELGAMYAAAAFSGFVYFAFFSNEWSRYLWQSAFAISFAIGSPLLPLRSVAGLLSAVTAVCFLIASPSKLERFYRSQTANTDGRILLEKREVLQLLETHRDLPLLGQSWQSIFDIVYLLPDGRRWLTLSSDERVINQPVIVLWNRFINRTGKYDAFPSSVEYHCSRLARELTFYTVYLCDGRS